MSQITILEENRDYWTHRASGYSEVSKTELFSGQRRKWADRLREEILLPFADRVPEEIRVLEVGTGPGFFAIILCELGFDVTAVDLTPAMLHEAQENAGAMAEKIRFAEMNAEELAFADSSFDVVISRNLTWNLPHPDRAYAEWTRILKQGGLLLNFDANWYAYLFDPKARLAYEMDRQNSAEKGVADQNVGENFDIMENIARRVPLSNVSRPAWDREILSMHGLFTETDEEIWRELWSEEEKLNFSSTPLFMIKARKLRPDV